MYLPICQKENSVISLLFLLTLLSHGYTSDVSYYLNVESTQNNANGQIYNTVFEFLVRVSGIQRNLFVFPVLNFLFFSLSCSEPPFLETLNRKQIKHCYVIWITLIIVDGNIHDFLLSDRVNCSFFAYNYLHHYL